MRDTKSIAILAAALLLPIMASCSGSANAKVSDLQFDWKTGDYSFSGVKDATQYRVRLFAVEVDETGAKKDSELPINESRDLKGGKDAYTGNVPLWSLTPGAAYRAYVLATFEKTSTVSDGVEGNYIYSFALPTSEDYTAQMKENGDIIVTVQSTLFSGTLLGVADFKVNLYQADMMLKSATIDGSKITYSSSFFGTSSTNNDVTFSGYDYAQMNSYSATITIIGRSESVIGTAESAKLAVSKYVESTGGGGFPGGGNPSGIR